MRTRRTKGSGRGEPTDLTRVKERATRCMARGDWHDALRALLVARDLAPDDTYVARKIGDVYQRLGKVDAAIEAYKNAARLFAEEGFLYKAVSVNKVVLALKPDDDEAREAVEMLMAQQKRHSGPPIEDLDPRGSVSAKAIGLYLDSLTRETMPWFPMLSDLLEGEVNLVFDMLARKTKRLQVLKKVDFTHEGDDHTAYTRDISASGAYLRTNLVVPEDTLLDLSFHLRDGQDPLRLRGTVARSSPGGEFRGFGIRFAPDGQQAALDALAEFVLDSLAEQARARLEKSPADVEALYDLADIAREKGDLDRTEEYLRRITGIESPSVAHGYLGELLLHRALESGDENLLREANELISVAASMDHGGMLDDLRAALKGRAGAARGSSAGEENPAAHGAGGEADGGDGSLSAFLASLEEREHRLDARQDAIEEREEKLAAFEEELEIRREELQEYEQQLGRDRAGLEEEHQRLVRRRRVVELWADDLMRKEKDLLARSSSAGPSLSDPASDEPEPTEPDGEPFSK